MRKFTSLLLCGLLLCVCSLAASAQTVSSFEGMDASQLAKPNYDIDPNGAVGTKQYMEWVNSYYQAWNKTTFAPVWAKPLAGTVPFNGNTNCVIGGDGMI